MTVSCVVPDVKEGAKYGLKLNKNKCEVLTTSVNADIKFADGTKVKRKPEVTYLGCQINQYSYIHIYTYFILLSNNLDD